MRAALGEPDLFGRMLAGESWAAWRVLLIASSKSITVRPVLESRLPVGSSARMIFGSFDNARAMATRCCSPPDSCDG